MSRNSYILYYNISLIKIVYSLNYQMRSRHPDRLRERWNAELEQSGSVRAAPREVLRPVAEVELAALVRAAAKLRVVGAGHSFMPLCATDGLLLNLEALEGGIEVASDRRTVTAPRAGASSG